MRLDAKNLSVSLSFKDSASKRKKVQEYAEICEQMGVETKFRPTHVPSARAVCQSLQRAQNLGCSLPNAVYTEPKEYLKDFPQENLDGILGCLNHDARAIVVLPKRNYHHLEKTMQESGFCASSIPSHEIGHLKTYDEYGEAGLVYLGGVRHLTPEEVKTAKEVCIHAAYKPGKKPQSGDEFLADYNGAKIDGVAGFSENVETLQQKLSAQAARFKSRIDKYTRLAEESENNQQV